MAMKIDELVKYSWKGQRVLTTKQLAGAYCFAPNTLFHRAEAFNKGEHYFILQGSELKEFKAIYPSANVASMLRLWTKRGAKLQAEIRNDPALLNVYKWLEENYFDVADTPADTAPIAEIPADTVQITDITPVEYSAQRVLTTEQLANFYECSTRQIKQNFNNNAERFVEGKHYYKLEGEELNKLRVENFDLQISPMTRALYLWTKRGAARHAKMLSTEKAWQVFELLEESYFEGKKVNPASAPIENTPSEMILEVGATRDAIKNVFGVAALKEGIALAKAIDLVGKHYNTDLSELNTFLPPATHKVGHLTPTDIGNKLGISAQAVNAKLKDIGLQYKDGKGNWILTDAGIYYGEMMPYVNKYSGHTGYYPLWNDSVLNLLYDQTRLF